MTMMRRYQKFSGFFLCKFKLKEPEKRLTNQFLRVERATQTMNRQTKVFWHSYIVDGLSLN